MTTMNTTTIIDVNWQDRPRSIACALLRSEDSVALIDPGPSSGVMTLRKQLAVEGVQISDVNAILLTHIHLDHAGATGTLVHENPQIQVYVHEKGIPHMVAPEKLLKSASRLYGDSMQRLFGEFLPVPQANLHSLSGGEGLRIAGRKLRVAYTPGHASHHVTYFDAEEGTVFVGDTAGICVEGNRFILPATPPPDISLELWDESLDTIASFHPRRLFLTHFAFSDHPAEHLARYRECLHHWSERTARILASGLDEERCIERFSVELTEEARSYLSPEELDHYAFNGALHLSWMGFARYHRKRAAGAPASAPH
jgi:glyoxylase-like metal-dependent hydrolase (beta-lactamase superfamily II)